MLSSLRGPTFLDPIPPLLLYIKPIFPLDKQFSIDSFLDWEGLHWDFSSPPQYPPYVVISPPLFWPQNIRHASIIIRHGTLAHPPDKINYLKYHGILHNIGFIPFISCLYTFKSLKVKQLPISRSSKIHNISNLPKSKIGLLFIIK